MAFRSYTSNFDDPAVEAEGRRTLWALVLAVVVCVLADLTFRLVLPRSGTVERYVTARQYVAEHNAPDIQILGDSVAFRGIIGSAFADDDSIYVRNDALGSSRPPFTYFFLRHELEAGNVPRAVILAHTPFSFDEPFVGLLAGTFLEWRELPELYLSTTEWTEALFGTLSRFSYILTNRENFRQLLKQGDYRFLVTPSSNYTFAPSEDLGKLQRFLDGYENPPARVSIKEALQNYRLTTFHVDEDTDYYFRKLLDLAAEYGVQVFWVTTPTPRSVRELLDTIGYEQGLLDYLHGFEDEGKLTVLQGSFITYEDELFDDILHPNREGAVEFSCAMRRFAPLLENAVTRAEANADANADTDAHHVMTPARNAALAEQREARQILGELCDTDALMSSDAV